MHIIFPLTWAAWILFEVVIGFSKGSKAEDRKNLDRHTLRMLWITIGVTCTAAGFASGMVPWPIANTMAVAYTGLALILLGCILRWLVIRSLGREFTVDVTIREGHTLKTDGIYAHVRHPSYSAALLSFLGFGLSLNNWASLILISTVITAAFLRRIQVEEAALTQQFGTEYEAYAKRTHRLVPFLY